MLGGPPVLGGDRIGVVAGHLHRRPPEASLLLGLGDHGVDGGGVKMAERVQMHVGCHASSLSERSEGVAHPVRVGRSQAAWLEGEDERPGSDARLACVGELLLLVTEGAEQVEG